MIMGVDPIYVILLLVTVMIITVVVMGLIMLKMVKLLGGIHNEARESRKQAKAYYDSGPHPIVLADRAASIQH